MDDNNVEAPAETPSDLSPSGPAPAVYHRWPPPLAALGFALSVSGAIVEIVWWKDAGYGWENLYRFLAAGAPFVWSFVLLLSGSALTWAHWRNSNPKGWATPGLLITSLWLLRITLGLAILALRWLWNQAGTDIVDASLPKKKQRKWRRRKPRTSRRGGRRKRKRRSKGRPGRKTRRYRGKTRGRRPQYNRRRRKRY